MSELHSSNPESRQAEYLQGAEAAIREATEPVMEALGRVVVSDAQEIIDGQETAGGPVSQAESLIAIVALGEGLGSEVEEYAHKHDYQLGEFSTDFADEVERFLRTRAIFEMYADSPLQKPGYSFDRAKFNLLKPKERIELSKLDAETGKPTDGTVDL